MVWSNLLPDGSKALNLGDNDLRANAAALEDALDEEHYFATGGSQTGRHRIGSGSAATRDIDISSPAAGNLWFVTDLVSGEIILQRYDGADWIAPDYGLLDVSQPWTAIQSAPYVAMGKTASALDLDWSDGHYQKYTMDADLTLGAGTNKPAANQGATIILELTQDGTGTRTLAYNAEYKSQAGSTPILSTAIGAIDQLVLTLMSGGSVEVSAKLGIA